jgi:hypothetical protein
MRRTTNLVIAFVSTIASALAQETVCDLFENLHAADGRQLTSDGELILTKGLAILASADCDKKFETPLYGYVLKGGKP